VRTPLVKFTVTAGASRALSDSRRSTARRDRALDRRV
jgi:hypothetical protein